MAAKTIEVGSVFLLLVDSDKYDFDLHKGFFMGKVNGPNSPDFEIQKFEIARVLQ